MLETGYKNSDLCLCPFCRMPFSESNEERIKMLNKLMKAGNADAFFQLGEHYADGNMDLPQDYAKANELYLKAGDLAVPRHFLT